MTMSTNQLQTLFLRAGCAEVTPKKTLEIAACRVPHTKFTNVADPLEINLLLLRQGSAHVAIFSADVLYLTDDLKREILRRIRNQNVLTETNVLFAASHTHFGPALDATKVGLGEVDLEYQDYFCDTARLLFERVLSHPETPVTMRYHAAPASHAVVRWRIDWKRNGFYVHRGVKMAPNFSIPAVETVHIVRFEGEQGLPQALLWSYGCHPVCFPEIAVSAEFPGVVRNAFRGKFRENLPVLYLQGFSGDVRPPAIARPKDVRTWAQRLINGPSFGPFDEKSYSHWSQSLAHRVLEILATANDNSLAPRLEMRQREISMADILDQDIGMKCCVLQHLRLAEDVSILGVGAEPVSEYVGIAQSIARGTRVIPAGCVGSVYGYLPTEKIRALGGYEGELFLSSFYGRAVRVRPGLEARMRDEFRALFLND